MYLLSIQSTHLQFIHLNFQDLIQDPVVYECRRLCIQATRQLTLLLLQFFLSTIQIVKDNFSRHQTHSRPFSLVYFIYFHTTFIAFSLVHFSFQLSYQAIWFINSTSLQTTRHFTFIVFLFEHKSDYKGQFTQRQTVFTSSLLSSADQTIWFTV